MFVLETIGTSELEARVAEATGIISDVDHTGVQAPAVRLDHATFVATITAVATEVAGATDPDEAKCLAELGRQMACDAAGRYQIATVRGHRDDPAVRQAFHDIAYAFAVWRHKNNDN